MTATDDRLAALLAAIRANPGDDLPRLVAADRYEELGGRLNSRRYRCV